MIQIICIIIDLFSGALSLRDLPGVILHHHDTRGKNWGNLPTEYTNGRPQ